MANGAEDEMNAIASSLTGVNAVGAGEASGMFPIDSAALGYAAEMLEKFSALPEGFNTYIRRYRALLEVERAAAAAG